jgi:hypothetical protein
MFYFFGIEWNKYLIDIVKPHYIYILFFTSIIDGTHVIIFGIGTISSSPTTT